MFCTSNALHVSANFCWLAKSRPCSSWKRNSRFSRHRRRQSIELVLKQNHTLCLFGHWFQSGQLANGLKQTPYCGQHNMVSREQQVSWPHSDTIRKGEKTHKEPGSSEGIYFILLFFCCSHVEAWVSLSWQWQGGQITMKCIFGFETFNIFNSTAVAACGATVWYHCASPPWCTSGVLASTFAFYFRWAFKSASREALLVSITLSSGGPVMNTLEDSWHDWMFIEVEAKRGRLLLKAGLTLWRGAVERIECEMIKV